MSSRFVSAGAIDAATGEATEPPLASTTPSATANSKKSQEWAEVQRQLDAARAAKATAAEVGAHGEKSLFEVLEANKAAKQAAHEEANKIKNQFRALDEDEIEYLEGVRERKREEEERVKRETEEGLKAFRERRGRDDRGREREREGERWEDDERWDRDEYGYYDRQQRPPVELGWAVGPRKRRRGEGDEGRKRTRGLGLVRRGVREGERNGERREDERRDERRDDGRRDERRDEERKGERKGERKAEALPAVESEKSAEETLAGQRKAAAATSMKPPQVPAAASVKKFSSLVDYGSSDDED